MNRVIGLYNRVNGLLSYLVGWYLHDVSKEGTTALLRIKSYFTDS
jgi:hypothetical protein